MGRVICDGCTGPPGRLPVVPTAAAAAAAAAAVGDECLALSYTGTLHKIAHGQRAGRTRRRT